MPSLFLKDEAISKAPPIVGFEILRYVQATERKTISIFDVVNHFKEEAWFSANSFFYGLTFLYALGLMDFEEPYLVVLDAH